MTHQRRPYLGKKNEFGHFSLKKTKPKMFQYNLPVISQNQSNTWMYIHDIQPEGIEPIHRKLRTLSAAEKRQEKAFICSSIIKIPQ